MKASKLLKNLDIRIDKLYDTLYMVREVFADIEDEEVDSLIEGFIEQVETVISEGDHCVPLMRDRISELFE